MYDPLLAALKGIDAIGSILNSKKTNNPTAPGETFTDQSFEGNPLLEFLSHGAGLNEIGTTYSHGPGTHHIRLLNLVSPDIMLVHQSRMVGFYLKLGDNQEIREVPRTIKNALVKDMRY